MSLPQIELDDRDFQDLVNEARMRISQSCPEWTEHNVSDPGITLIELFAWMTEMLDLPAQPRARQAARRAARAARDPRSQPPDGGDHRSALSARSTPPPSRSTDPGAGHRGRHRAHGQRGVDRLPDHRRRSRSRRCAPSAYARRARRRGARTSASPPAWPSRSGRDQLPFAHAPGSGDALYLGFDTPLARLCSARRRRVLAGARRRASTPTIRRCAGRSRDGDERLDRGDGARGSHRRLQLRQRRRSSSSSRRGRQRARGRPARSLGALPRRRAHPRAALRAPTRTRPRSTPQAGADRRDHPATHAAPSIGRAARRERRHARPGLHRAPRPGAHRRPGRRGSRCATRAAATGCPGSRCESFAESGPDRPRTSCSTLADGQMSSGRRSALPDGSWRASTAQCRRRARSLRMTPLPRTAAAGAATSPRARSSMPKSSIPGVATVTNPRPAVGGVDPESLESTRLRAAMEFRTRYRAVTAAGLRVPLPRGPAARGPRVCVPRAGVGGAIPVRLRPGRVDPADRQLAAHELIPDAELLARGRASYLDERRLLGTTVESVPARLRGVTVVVNVQSGAAQRPAPRRGRCAACALPLPEPAGRRIARGHGHRLGLRPGAQPGRAVRRGAGGRTASTS